MSDTFKVTEKLFKKEYMDKSIHEEKLKDIPFVSITKSGKKWYWVGWINYSQNETNEDTAYRKVDAEGYADTKEQALEDGREALGIEVPEILPEYVYFESSLPRGKKCYVIRTILKTEIDKLLGYCGARLAKGIIKSINAKKRYEKQNSFGGSGQTMEFAYTEGLGWNFTHRVIKRTKKKVFIDSDMYRGKDFNPSGFESYLGRNIVVDREKFDAGEEIWLRSKDCLVFNEKCKQEKDRERGQRDAEMWGNISRQFELLGVELPTTKDVIKRAYREKVKIYHPDAGGSDQDFTRLNEEYKEVMNFVD